MWKKLFNKFADLLKKKVFPETVSISLMSGSQSGANGPEAGPLLLCMHSLCLFSNEMSLYFFPRGLVAELLSHNKYVLAWSVAVKF